MTSHLGHHLAPGFQQFRRRVGWAFAAVDTALGFGMSAREMDLDYQPFPLSTLYDPENTGGAAFLSFVNACTELAGTLHVLSRSLAQPDF